MDTWESWLTLSVVIGLLIGLAVRAAATDLLALAALGIIVLAQGLSGSPLLPTPEQAVAGFGSKGVVTIGLLFAVVAGLEFTGGAELATGWLLNKAKNLTDAHVRMLVPVAALSGFLNNTPVVAAMLPIVGDLAKKISTSPSRLLLPLSYAAILGGMCTLMGTSTNLIVRDRYSEELRIQATADLDPSIDATDAELQIAKFVADNELSFFTPAVIGLPATIIGLVYLIFGSRYLLPARKPGVCANDDPQQYTVEMQVDPHGPLVGRTIEQAGLRRLPGLYVAEIQRSDGRIVPAKPEEQLLADDVLILVGAIESVVDLRKIRGLATPDDQARKLQIPAWRRTLVEAVVSPRCSSLGKSIRESRFRSRYNAAVVAVARGGQRLEGKLGDVRLEVGDVLLLEASPSFLHRQQTSRDFYLVSKVQKGEVRRHDRAWQAIAIVIAMVVAAAGFGIPILTVSMVAVVAMVVMRCCTTHEARRSVDWSVLIIIGAAIGLGTALKKSGTANAIAEGLLSMAGHDPFFSLVAIYLATVICTEFITNTAAAVLMLHIGLETAQKLNLDETPYVIAVMIAASASFLTPFGYQTNLMVYSVGGYRLSDYLRLGLPLSLIVFAIAMTIIPWWFG